MEQNHKNTDCYFFYYSKCSKGDTCAFRHEPSALGCETVCSYWQQGNCLNEHCNFRHMELKKNRKSIACYWETQPSGCMKPHCPFLHRNERPGIESSTPINQGKTPETISAKPTNQEWSNRQEDSKFDGSSTESDQGRGSSEAGSFIGSPVVDPLIVNFEEESDSEDAASPVKRSHNLSFTADEQERLNAIQTEVAAYYEYQPGDYKEQPAAGKMTTIPTVRHQRSRGGGSKYNYWKTSSSADQDFKVLTLEEIRRRKQAAETSKSLEMNLERNQNSGEDSLNDAIETLEELAMVNRSMKSESKRCISEVENEEEGAAKIQKVDKVEGIKIPPIKLRRIYKSGGFELERRSTPEVFKNVLAVEESEILKDIDALLSPNAH
ncbi:zinc finger CCCH domain-containing protein 11A-like isoform X2 [Belonocnema kinseyi]|nr:zinc finger CCCH domain-containing protein 11A-like isoform X2 [Belonocnema kinseyi]